MEPNFQTNDFDLAAYLFACTLPVETESMHGKTTFIFPSTAEITAEAFYYGAAIPAKRLLQAFHQLEILQEGR